MGDLPMKRSLLTVTVAFLSILTSTVSSASAQTAAHSKGGASFDGVAAPQNADNSAVWLKQLIAEIRELRRDLLEQRVENLEATIGQLESELQQVEADQRRLPGEERAQSHEIAALDEQLAQSTLSPDERAELEASRNELAAGGMKRLRAETLSLTQRSAKLRERLQQSQQQRQKLIERAKEMGFGAQSR
jgi:prefoldin subunit 5